MARRGWILAGAVLGLVLFGCIESLDGFSGGTNVGPEAGVTVEAGVTPTSTDSGHTDVDSVVAVSADPYGDVVRVDDPTSWYRLEDAVDATEAKDEMGNHVAARLAGVTFGAAGISGHAASFTLTGGGGGLDLGDVFDFANFSPFTIEMWMTTPTTTAGDRRLAVKRDESVSPFEGWILYSGNTNYLAFEFWSIGLDCSSNAPLPTGYSHLVVTGDYSTGTGTGTMYINGVAQTASDTGNTIPAPDTAVHAVFGDSWNGLIDEIAIYDHALTPERVLAHYNAVPKH